MNSERLQIMSNTPRAERPSQQNVVTKFSTQKIEMSQAPFFFPSGYENLFLFVYFITLPYLTGLIFLFTYVANGNVELFIPVSDNSPFIFVWAIGYEVLAALFFLFIIKLFLDSIRAEQHTGKFNKKFKRPQ